MMRNGMEMTLTLKRIDVCDLLLACLAAKELANDEGKKWEALHQMLKEQLDAFDAQIDAEEAKKDDLDRIKKDFQKVIGQIRKDEAVEGERRPEFPKAMMTNQQMEKRTATVNCGGEWRSYETTVKIASQVMKDGRFKDFLTRNQATAEFEKDRYGKWQIRIKF